MALHDPLAVWFALTSAPVASRTSQASTESMEQGKGSADEASTEWHIQRAVDIRVESSGQWTRGALIVDRRGREKKKGGGRGDAAGWLDVEKGNRLDLVVQSGVEGELGEIMLKRVFGL
jgi:inosine-uridine nucleoside N-ribohydrolase